MERDEGVQAGDPLDLLEEARRRCLDEIEFHEQEKERHATRISELRRAFGNMGGGAITVRRKSRRHRRAKVAAASVKGRFDANDGQTVSVGRMIVDFLRSRPNCRATNSEIETHLSEKGRPCKPGVALSRLLEEGWIVKVERGVYELAPGKKK